MKIVGSLLAFISGSVTMTVLVSAHILSFQSKPGNLETEYFMWNTSRCITWFYTTKLLQWDLVVQFRCIMKNPSGSVVTCRPLLLLKKSSVLLVQTSPTVICRKHSWKIHVSKCSRWPLMMVIVWMFSLNFKLQKQYFNLNLYF